MDDARHEAPSDESTKSETRNSKDAESLNAKLSFESQHNTAVRISNFVLRISSAARRADQSGSRKGRELRIGLRAEFIAGGEADRKRLGGGRRAVRQRREA